MFCSIQTHRHFVTSSMKYHINNSMQLSCNDIHILCSIQTHIHTDTYFHENIINYVMIAFPCFPCFVADADETLTQPVSRYLMSMEFQPKQSSYRCQWDSHLTGLAHERPMGLQLKRSYVQRSWFRFMLMRSCHIAIMSMLSHTYASFNIIYFYVIFKRIMESITHRETH
jgi:hypothetical protein